MNTNIEYISFDSSKFNIVREIRTAVFTNEQGANASEEFDELDKSSTFAILYEDNKPVGTARAVEYKDGYKIGRIAISKSCRGKGYGADIVNAISNKAVQMGASKIYVDAQNYAVPFYEKLGFKVIGDELIDRGLPHMPMLKEIQYEK